MSLPIHYHEGDKSDHDEAMKWMLKSRLSHIHTQIDKRPLRGTADSLGRLLSELKAYMDGLG